MEKYGISVAANSTTNGAPQMSSYTQPKTARNALRLKALKDVNYQLTDLETGEKIEDLTFQRVGDDLYISTKDNNTPQPDIVIEEYYLHHGTINDLQVSTVKSVSDILTADQVAVATATETDSGFMGSTLFKVLGGIAGLGLIAGASAGGGGSSSAAGTTLTKTADSDNLVATFAADKSNSELILSNTAKTENATDNITDSVAASESAPLSSDLIDNEITVAKDEEATSISFSSIEAKAEEFVVLDSVATSSETSTMPSVGEMPAINTNSEIFVPNEEVSSVDSLTEEVASSDIPQSAIVLDTASLNSQSSTTAKISTEVVFSKASGSTPAIYLHSEYGKFIKASDFGTDPTGKTDSLAAIKAALSKANELGVAVKLSGQLYISDQIVWDNTYANVTALFGEGNGRINGTDAPSNGQTVAKTLITFYKEQAMNDIFNSNTNTDNVDKYAGILIKGQKDKIIGDLSVEYLHKKASDFYRFYANSDQNSSYFGKINGIVVTDSDHITIQRVEVSGANRAGIYFTSSDALKDDPNISGNNNYVNLIRSGEIDDSYQHLPLGEGNKVINSYLHDNRVAGLLFGYQKDFTAEGNLASYNGHIKDGGTGYGIAASAGAYNYDIKYLNNTTDHNYRKGLDIHDGNRITVEGNTSIGDRQFGIAVYNRHYTMDDVTIKNNTIVQDPSFVLTVDDFGAGNAASVRGDYYSYTAIQLTSNNNGINLNSHKISDGGTYIISDNTIKGLSLVNTKYKTATFGIEFRNQEALLDYTLDISNNQIVESDSASYIVGILNNTTKTNGISGLGSGTINVSDNTAVLNKVSGGVPIYVQDSAYMTYNATTKRNVVDPNKAMTLRGSVNIEDNIVLVKQASNNDAEAIEVYGNAETYTIRNNVFELEGSINTAVFRINGVGKEKSDLILENNTIYNQNQNPASIALLTGRYAGVNIVDKNALKTNKYSLTSSMPDEVSDAVKLKEPNVDDDSSNISYAEVLTSTFSLGGDTGFSDISVGSLSYTTLAVNSTLPVDNTPTTIM